MFDSYNEKNHNNNNNYYYYLRIAINFQNESTFQCI